MQDRICSMKTRPVHRVCLGTSFYNLVTPKEMKIDEE